MKKIIGILFGFVILSSFVAGNQSFATTPSDPSFQELLNSSNKIVCKTAGRLFPRSEVVIDLKTKRLEVPRFNLNDDHNNNFGDGAGAFRPFSAEAYISDQIIESTGECSGRPLYGINTSMEKYSIQPAPSLKGNRFKATVNYCPCIFMGYTDNFPWNQDYRLSCARNAGRLDPHSFASVKMNCRFSND